MLPKLRKENIYLESDLNSTLQVHLYDFLYDQQDLYDFYDDAFNEKEEDDKYVINPRNPDLPFASSLIDIDSFKLEFSPENEKNSLGKMRWYSYNETANYQDNIKYLLLLIIQ